MSDNSEYFTKYIALFKAIESNDLITVQRLLQSKINVEQIDASGRTLTQVAIYWGNVDIAKILLKAGAKFHFLDEHSFGRAIYNRRLDVITFFIEMGIDVNLKFQEDENTTALIEAAQIGDIEIVKKLVESGSEVNAINDKNDFALMNAASQGWQEIYDYLAPLTSPQLQKRAKKALDYGLIYRKRKDDKLLDKFMTSAATGDIEGVLRVIKGGININAFGENRTTALFVAANWGYIPVVRSLIEAGANVNLGEEDNKETPLMIAAARTALQKNKVYVGGNGHIEVIKLLLKAGANVNARTSFGWTALMAAANAGSIEVVQLLLKAGANINHKDINKDTALSRAEEAGYFHIAQLLREAGTIKN